MNIDKVEREAKVRAIENSLSMACQVPMSLPLDKLSLKVNAEAIMLAIEEVEIEFETRWFEQQEANHEKTPFDA